MKFNSPSHKVDVFRSSLLRQRRILIRRKARREKERERVNVPTVPCKNRYSASLSHEDPEEAPVASAAAADIIKLHLEAAWRKAVWERW